MGSTNQPRATMSSERLDAVDRGILHLLQQNARDLTPVDMAERLPVSDGTVRNRIERLEEDGVIDGYVPLVDYESAGLPMQAVFTCTCPVDAQEAVALEALDVHRVVRVRELVASDGNVEVVAVGADLDDLVEVAERLADLGLDIHSQKLVRNEYERPFDHFGAADASDD